MYYAYLEVMSSDSIPCLHSKCGEKLILVMLFAFFWLMLKNDFRVVNPFTFLKKKSLLTRSPYVCSLPVHKTLIFSQILKDLKSSKAFSDKHVLQNETCIQLILDKSDVMFCLAKWCLLDHGAFTTYFQQL